MPDQPNIVFVIMDDLAWGDLACHGNPHTRTPRLDSLHAESARFTRTCTGPLCSPARASVMTGRYHLRTRVIDTYCGRSSLDASEITIAHCLEKAGYRTGAFGKWHLGDTYPNRACDMGFQETLMHNAGGIGQPGDHYRNREDPERCYFDPTLMRNGVPETSEGYCTDVFTDEAIAFITRHQDHPFFCYLATNAPHGPLQIADEWADPYRDMGLCDTHARLYGMVENIDWNVGRLLDKLDELELADNTIVVYTSDHGPCGSSTDPVEGQRWNANLRGIKGTLYQGGIQVPTFWRWPGHFQAGVDIDRITSPIDVLPTLAEVAGANLPDQPIDGVSLLPLLTGDTAPGSWPERTLYMQWHRGDLPLARRNAAVITQQHKLYWPDSHSLTERSPAELYDLSADPLEQHDLASQQPDLVEALAARYDHWFAEMGATRGPGTYDPQPIIVGSEEEPITLLTRNDWRPHGPVDAWNNDDVRCHWELDIAQTGDYRIDIRFKPGTAAGIDHVRTDAAHVAVQADAGQAISTLDSVHLPAGRTRLEAWRTLDELNPDVLYHRFMPAMYVELQRVGEQI